MNWEIHDAAKKIADGWYSELEETRERNAILGRENTKLRELVQDLVCWYGTEHQPHEELRFWGDKSSGVYARMRELEIEAEQ